MQGVMFFIYLFPCSTLEPLLMGAMTKASVALRKIHVSWEYLVMHIARQWYLRTPNENWGSLLRLTQYYHPTLVHEHNHDTWGYTRWLVLPNQHFKELASWQISKPMSSHGYRQHDQFSWWWWQVTPLSSHQSFCIFVLLSPNREIDHWSYLHAYYLHRKKTSFHSKVYLIARCTCTYWNSWIQVHTCTQRINGFIQESRPITQLHNISMPPAPILKWILTV